VTAGEFAAAAARRGRASQAKAVFDYALGQE
jgi:hypothetical protein